MTNTQKYAGTIIYECRCGEVRMYGPSRPSPCSGCDECGTTLEINNKGYKNRAKHEYYPHLISGKKVCTQCNHMEDPDAIEIDIVTATKGNYEAANILEKERLEDLKGARNTEDEQGADGEDIELSDSVGQLEKQETPRPVVGTNIYAPVGSYLARSAKASALTERLLFEASQRNHTSRHGNGPFWVCPLPMCVDVAKHLDIADVNSINPDTRFGGTEEWAEILINMGLSVESYIATYQRNGESNG